MSAGPETQPDDLGAAWAAAEAALPEGWRLTVANTEDYTAWGAWAFSDAFYEGRTDDDRCEGTGPTPAAALCALTVHLLLADAGEGAGGPQ